MKMATRRTTGPETSLGEDYRSALDEYATQSGEAALGRAYDLGRKAMTEGKSLLEIVAIHHEALQGIVRETKKEKRQAELLRASAEFLAESLSPYDMAHRGFQDAVKALRQFNETLEEEIKRIAYAVHDEAGQVLVAVHLALAIPSGLEPLSPGGCRPRSKQRSIESCRKRSLMHRNMQMRARFGFKFSEKKMGLCAVPFGMMAWGLMFAWFAGKVSAEGWD